MRILSKVPVAARIVLGISVIIGGIISLTYWNHRVGAKYQRICQEQIRSIPGAGDSDSQKCQDPKQYMPWWYALDSWPDGIAAWGLLATLGAILWQSWETRRAASAQADGNRAWIFADLEKIEGRGFINGSSYAKGEERSRATYLMLRLNLRNEGLSPAWIESIQAHMEILPRKQTPPKKVLFTSFPYRPTIMVKGEEVINPDLECPGHMTKETDDIFIWVVVRYHDGHGIQGETSLGYGMSLSGMLFRQNDLHQRNYNK